METEHYQGFTIQAWPGRSSDALGRKGIYCFSINKGPDEVFTLQMEVTRKLAVFRHSARDVTELAAEYGRRWVHGLIDLGRCEPGEAYREQRVEGRRLAALYTLAIYCGLREGELLGLHWADVDLETATLRVRLGLQRNGGKLRFAELKTEKSRRTIALPDPVVEALREHKRRQREERMRRADVWQDHDLVFPSEVGTPLEPRNLIRQWHRVRKRIGRPDLRFHDLRHACATIWLASGEHPKIVQELLGHHSITMTMDTYSHVIPATHREAAQRIGRLLNGTG